MQHWNLINPAIIVLVGQWIPDRIRGRDLRVGDLNSERNIRFKIARYRLAIAVATGVLIASLWLALQGSQMIQQGNAVPAGQVIPRILSWLQALSKGLPSFNILEGIMPYILLTVFGFVTFKLSRIIFNDLKKIRFYKAMMRNLKDGTLAEWQARMERLDGSMRFNSTGCRDSPPRTVGSTQRSLLPRPNETQRKTVPEPETRIEAELKRADQLKAKGLITDEEHQALRKKALGL